MHATGERLGLRGDSSSRAVTGVVEPPKSSRGGVSSVVVGSGGHDRAAFPGTKPTRGTAQVRLLSPARARGSQPTRHELARRSLRKLHRTNLPADCGLSPLAVVREGVPAWWCCAGHRERLEEQERMS